MIYDNIVPGIFIKRLNRFIAEVEIEGEINLVHVKNTGRCAELFIAGTQVYLQKSDNPARKTKYSLITIEKGDRLINIDSQIPNKVFFEANPIEADLLLPEKTYKDSRFDFYLEKDGQKGFAEVKGVTLEVDNIAYFPDAPTLRGVKHINGLIDAKENGMLAYLIFIIQMENIKIFRPNRKTHLEFAIALEKAKQAGVEILAYECEIGKQSISLYKNVEIDV